MGTEIKIDPRIRFMSAQEKLQNDAVRFSDANVRIDVEQRTESNGQRSMLARLFRCGLPSEKRLKVSFGLREIIDCILIELRCCVTIIAEVLDVGEISVGHVRWCTEIGKRKKTMTVTSFIPQKIIGIFAENEIKGE